MEKTKESLKSWNVGKFASFDIDKLIALGKEKGGVARPWAPGRKRVSIIRTYADFSTFRTHIAYVRCPTAWHRRVGASPPSGGFRRPPRPVFDIAYRDIKAPNALQVNC